MWNSKSATRQQPEAAIISSTDMNTSCFASDDGSVQYLASPVEPAELAAATLAHQASLDMGAMHGAGQRQVLSGRDAGSLNQKAARLNCRSQSRTAAAENPDAQPSLVHAAGLPW